MPDGIFTPILISLLASLGIGVVNNEMSRDNDRYWWDFYSYFIIFPEEYTNIIDELLTDSNHSKLGPTMMISNNKRIPGLGVHYYYVTSRRHRGFMSRRFVRLEKNEKDGDERKITYYRASHSPFYWGKESFSRFSTLVMTPGRDTVRVFSISQAHMQPTLICMTKICKNPRPHQTQAIDLIMDRYNERNDYNVKVIISGFRGLGKTYTALPLKKRIDRANVFARLYDNFNPSAIGVDVQEMALKYAGASTPVILVMNEVDILFNQALSEDRSFDPREQHTRSKTTFNNMLDAIGSVKHVISIMTTEKTPEQLRGNAEYASFIREGRVDMMIHMTQDGSVEA